MKNVQLVTIHHQKILQVVKYVEQELIQDPEQVVVQNVLQENTIQIQDQHHQVHVKLVVLELIQQLDLQHV